MSATEKQKANTAAEQTPKVIYVERQSPPLIPDETASVCFTRRNLFDIFIAILLAVIIIYIVVQYRKSKKLEDAFGGIAEAVTARPSPPAALPPAITSGVAPGLASETAREMLGGGKGMVMKWVRSFFK